MSVLPTVKAHARGKRIAARDLVMRDFSRWNRSQSVREDHMDSHDTCTSHTYDTSHARILLFAKRSLNLINR